MVRAAENLEVSRGTINAVIRSLGYHPQSLGQSQTKVDQTKLAELAQMLKEAPVPGQNAV